MSKEKNNLEKISNYYLKKQTNIDKKLVQFRYDTIKKYFKGNSCLEIGTAEGLMTQNLLKNFKIVTVVEASKKLLSEVNDHKRLIKINSLVENFKTRKKYKTIILDHVLEHVKYPNKTLKKIYNLLDKNGIFIVGVPNADSFHRLIAVEMGILKRKNSLNVTDHKLGHRRVYTPFELKKTLIKNGFKIKKFEGIFLKTLSNKQIDDFFNENTINGFFKIGKKFPYNCADICYICQK